MDQCQQDGIEELRELATSGDRQPFSQNRLVGDVRAYILAELKGPRNKVGTKRLRGSDMCGHENEP